MESVQSLVEQAVVEFSTKLKQQLEVAQNEQAQEVIAKEKWVTHNGFKVRADAVPNTGKYAQAKQRVEKAVAKQSKAKATPKVAQAHTQAKSKTTMPAWVKGLVDFWQNSEHAKFVSVELYDAEAGIWNIAYKANGKTHVKGYRCNSRGMVYCCFRQ